MAGKQYSERQLLMLSNLVYLPCSVSYKSIDKLLDEYREPDGTFSAKSVENAGTGGGLSSEDVCILFEEIDEEIGKDSEFGNLSATRFLNGGNVKAICYTNGKNDSPVVAFRGTGGSNEAWTDNFKGGYEVDTKMQLLAADFIKNECSEYENLVVTGHSKGGNLSQYATIACADVVSRCVSFDGQGFNEKFIAENEEIISKNAGKIKSISAYNDFVNILLTPIAGEVIYVKNKETVAAAHSPLTILTSNEFDRNGNFSTTQEQSVITKNLKKLTDKVVDVVEPADDTDKSMMSFVAGTTIASALNIDGKDSATKTVSGLLGSLSSIFVKKLADTGKMSVGEKSLFVTSCMYDNSGIMLTSQKFQEAEAIVRILKARVEEIKDDLAYNIASKVYVERKLGRLAEDIERISIAIKEYDNVLRMCLLRYEQKEKTLTQLIGR